MESDDKDMAAAPRAGSAGAEKTGKLKEDWIGRQLRRVFDEAIGEELPDDIASLLDQLDEEPAAKVR